MGILCSLTRKNACIEAHTATLKARGGLYGLGKLKVPGSKELYQASCEIEKF